MQKLLKIPFIWLKDQELSMMSVSLRETQSKSETVSKC